MRSVTKVIVKAISTEHTAIIATCCDGGSIKLEVWPGGGGAAGKLARSGWLMVLLDDAIER
jgi:hypothetical protein